MKTLKEFNSEIKSIDDEIDNLRKSIASQIEVLEYKKECIKEEKVDFLRYQNNFELFCKEKYKIYNRINDKYVQFELYSQQKDIVNLIEKNHLSFIEGSRQLGFTSLMYAYIIWNLIYKENFNIAYFVHTNIPYNTMSKNFNDIFYDYIDKDFLYKDSLSHKFLKNNSKIMFCKYPDDLIGFSVDLFILDDFNLYENNHLDTRLLRNMDSCGKDAKVIIKTDLDMSANEIIKNNLSINKYNSLKIEWFNCEQLNKDIVWVKNDEILKNVSDENFEGLLFAGYKPTNDWFKCMIQFLSYDNIKTQLGRF